MSFILQKLEQFTIDNSNFDTKRDYISMSHAYLSIDELINQYKNGFEYSKEIALKCYKGYQMEKDLLERLEEIFNLSIEIPGQELIACSGLIKGHPDFNFEDYPGDIKSVLMDEWLPKNGKLPKKVYWQMQAYMKYSCKEKSVIIYESRQTGLLQEIWIRKNEKIQEEIHNKFMEIDRILAN